MGKKLGLFFAMIIMSQWAFAEAEMTFSSKADANIQGSEPYTEEVDGAASIEDGQSFPGVKKEQGKEKVESDSLSSYFHPKSKGELPAKALEVGKTIKGQAQAALMALDAEDQLRNPASAVEGQTKVNSQDGLKKTQSE